MIVETEDTFMEDANRRTHILSALENRTQPIPSDIKDKTNTEKSSRVGKKRYVKALKDICSGQVSLLLSQHTVAANKYLQKLVYTSSDVAEFLLTCLIKSGQLNVSTLRKLADHWYVTKGWIELNNACNHNHLFFTIATCKILYWILILTVLIL